MGLYDYTHVCCQWKKRLDLKGERCFDLTFNGERVHPNIKPLDTFQHLINIFEYHRKEPVELYQLEPLPKGSGDVYSCVVDAPTLAEACQQLGVEVKTVNDVNLLRNNRSRRQMLPVLDNMCKFTFQLEGTWRSLWLTGPSGIGKTQWAIAEARVKYPGKEPLLISHMDDLKQFDERIHNVMIFDDMSFNHLWREVMIHLTDWDIPRTLNVKHATVTIPHHTPKIFTTNVDWDEYWPADPHGAIKRRVRQVVFPQNTRLYSDERVDDQVPPATEEAHTDNDDGYMDMCRFNGGRTFDEIEDDMVPNTNGTNGDIAFLQGWSQLV